MRSLVTQGRNHERGAFALFFVLYIGFALGVGALALDLGRGLVTRAELGNAADAATLAANRELALIYSEQPTRDYKTWRLNSDERARIVAKARRYASLNKADGRSVALRDEDVVLGTFNPATGVVTPATTGVRAVSVVTRRDSLANGAIPVSLGRAIGSSTISVSAAAAAGLSPLGVVPPGALTIPVGIASYWFERNACGPNSSIRFSPTGDLQGCAAWHTYTESPANAARLKSILGEMRGGDWTSPGATAGETRFQFIGGTVSSAFPQIEALYNARKNEHGEWSVLVPVYRASDCSNANGAITIAGFATARITAVRTAPDHTIEANVDCGIIDVGRADGAPDYGTLSGRPGMIR